VDADESPRTAYLTQDSTRVPERVPRRSRSACSRRETNSTVSSRTVRVAVYVTHMATRNPYEVDLWKDQSSYRGFAFSCCTATASTCHTATIAADYTALVAVARKGSLSGGGRPVGFENSATGCGLAIQAARWYSLVSPPRMGRCRVRSWVRSATGWSGRGGRRSSDRCGGARLWWAACSPSTTRGCRSPPMNSWPTAPQARRYAPTPHATRHRTRPAPREGTRSAQPAPHQTGAADRRAQPDTRTATSQTLDTTQNPESHPQPGPDRKTNYPQ
jgi:hypothetical protein